MGSYKEIGQLRAIEALRYTALGKTTRQVAVMMGVSVRTVNAYKNQLRRWLGVPSTYAVIYVAVSVGLIPPVTGDSFPKPDLKCVECAYKASLQGEA